MEKYLFDLVLLHSVTTLEVLGRTAIRKIAAGSLAVAAAQNFQASDARWATQDYLSGCSTNYTFELKG
jgi:hypothetical protein